MNLPVHQGCELVPDGTTLGVDRLAAAARDAATRVVLTPAIRQRVRASRALLDELVASGRIIYGVTTSVGGFVNWLVPARMAGEIQNNILRAVQTNVGRCLDDVHVRAAMLARINSLGRGASAISLGNLETYVAMFNAGVVPLVPEKGSLGTSGDLGPLACIALVGTGQWRARFDGRVMSGGEALAAAGITPMTLDYKEGLALVNGTSAMSGLAACIVAEAKQLITLHTLATCLSLEVQRAKIMPYHPAAHAQKPHPGQVRFAACVYQTLADSCMIVRDEEVERWLRGLAGDQPRGLDEQIEDAYSLRAAPQVMGPVLDTVAAVEQVITTEINSSNDNPLVVPELGDAVHNANFHGQYIANAMDQLALVLVTMCNLSERRNNRLLHPSLNGSLPPFLVREGLGRRLGLMGGQFMATSLTAEVRQMATPLSVQSLPSTGDFQDHVSFGLNAARRTRDILANTRFILGFELLCACQAADIRGRHLLSSATRRLHERVRQYVPYLDHDEPLTDILECIADLFARGELLDTVPREIVEYRWAA